MMRRASRRVGLGIEDISEGATAAEGSVRHNYLGEGQTAKGGIGGWKGIKNEFDGLKQGRSGRHIRLVKSDEELRSLYNRWSANGVDITPEGFDGTRVKLPDGTEVTWREKTTSTPGHPTVEIKTTTSKTVRKVHVE